MENESWGSVCNFFMNEENLGISIHLCIKDDVENFVLLGDVDTDHPTLQTDGL